MDRYSNGLKVETHIVLVEDETIIAMDLQQCLERFGYIVDEVASTTEEALFYVEKYKPNIVLMDIKLKDSCDGTEVVEVIQQQYKVPVIYLTSHSDNKTLQRAQATKPYGYIVKPADENQLNVSIKMVLSRVEEERKNRIGELVMLGNSYTYKVKTKELYNLSEKVNLTKKEGEFFSFMIHKLNCNVSYEEIIKNIWYSKDIPTATLRSLVRRVRYKLKEELIESISLTGYRVSGEKGEGA
jgi:DNA-binding response OmpR family regulator